MRYVIVLLLSLALANPAFPQSQQPEMDVTSERPGPEMTGPEIHTLIDQRDAQEGLSIAIEFESGADINLVKELVVEHELKRVLAYITPMRGMPPIGMGTFYDQDRAWQYGICRILMTMSFEGLKDGTVMEPERWPIYRLQVYSTAGEVREFIGASGLPPFTVTEANPQPRHVETRFEQAVRREADQPIPYPPDFIVPEFCAQFQGPLM